MPGEELRGVIKGKANSKVKRSRETDCYKEACFSTMLALLMATILLSTCYYMAVSLKQEPVYGERFLSLPKKKKIKQY